MGNNMAIDGGCCAPDRESLKRTNTEKMVKPECYGPPKFEGDVISLSYTEWEEIIALSRAITPGGKLLGLSSTKKMLCTLHKTNAPMILPGFGSNVQHFFSIQLWEISKNSGVEKLRSQLNGSNNDDKKNGNPKMKNKMAESTLKTVPIGFLELEPGLHVHQVAILDSANPQYVAATISRRESSSNNTKMKSNRIKKKNNKKNIIHEIFVWRLELATRKHLIIVDDELHTKKNKKYKTKLNLILRLKGNQPSIEETTTTSVENTGQNLTEQDLDSHNHLLPMISSECKAMTTLRDHLFVGKFDLFQSLSTLLFLQVN